MQDTVFKLALAVIIASAIMFMLAGTFSNLDSSTNTSISNVEKARMTALNSSVAYLQR